MKASPRFVLQVLASGSACLIGAAAHADLANPVNVELSAPGGVVGDSTPIDVSQSVLPSMTISSGDGTDIGGWMETGEQIAFSGNSILVQVAAGYDGGSGSGPFTTGYLGLGGAHALYQLSNLAVTGMAITGIQVYDFDNYASSGFSGLLSPTSSSAYVQLLSPTSIALDLDNLVFVNRGDGGSGNFADIRINLLTSPVPEPATWGLWLAGLGLLIARQRKRAA